MQTKDMAQDKLMVIVAGGSGTRMGGQLPKQFMDLMGRPVLMHTVELMSQVPSTRIVVVLPSEHQSLWQDANSTVLAYPTPWSLEVPRATRVWLMVWRLGMASASLVSTMAYVLL